MIRLGYASMRFGEIWARLCMSRSRISFSLTPYFALFFTATDSNTFLWILLVDPSSAFKLPSVKEIHLISAHKLS